MQHFISTSHTLSTLLASEPTALDIKLTGLSIDTRTLTQGQVFLAIKGENFDGHDYVNKAYQCGASLAIVQHKQNSDCPQLIVKETSQALLQIAKHWRCQFTCPIIAITGSNGKTSVKEMLKCLLNDTHVTATQGNFNNQIGLPLMLLNLSKQSRYGLFELGTSYPGEIKQLVETTLPDIALVNNVGHAHIEGLGSLSGVAAEKATIYNTLNTKGYGIINYDDAHCQAMQEILIARNAQCLTFGIKNKADLQAIDLINFPHSSQFTLCFRQQHYPVKLPLLGQHNVANALAALAIGIALNINIAILLNNLKQIKVIPGRMAIKKGIAKATIIDDTYNANFNSLAAGLSYLSSLAGQKILILGDMGELGEKSVDIHRQAGALAKKKKISSLYTYGALSKHSAQSFGQDGHHFNEQKQLINALIKKLDANTTVLVKGSRSMHMENIVKAIVEES